MEKEQLIEEKLQELERLSSEFLSLSEYVDMIVKDIRESLEDEK